MLGNAIDFIPLKFLQHIASRGVIPVYHSVSNNEVSHLKYLFKVKTVRQFEDDLDRLLKVYKPIDAETLVSRVKNEGRIRKKEFFLTFDDGLRECIDVIAPILLKKGIPAAFFVNNEFVDNKALFFRHKVSAMIDHILHAGEKFSTSFTVKYGDPQLYLKSLTYSDTTLLEEMAKKIGFSENDYLKDNSPYMTTSQIIKLSSYGFSIGAHSVNHPRYDGISLEEQIFQTQSSLNFVKHLVNQDNKLFAFPFSSVGVDVRLYDSIDAEQCDLFFGTSGGAKSETNRLLQRIPFENEFFPKGSTLLKVYHMVNLIRNN